MKKNILVFILAFVLILTLSACGPSEYNGKCDLDGTVFIEYTYNDSEGFTYYKDDTGEYSEAELDELNLALALEGHGANVEGVHKFIDTLNAILGEDVCTYED